jgi:hypothetical protein
MKLKFSKKERKRSSGSRLGRGLKLTISIVICIGLVGLTGLHLLHLATGNQLASIPENHIA